MKEYEFLELGFGSKEKKGFEGFVQERRDLGGLVQERKSDLRGLVQKRIRDLGVWFKREEGILG